VKIVMAMPSVAKSPRRSLPRPLVVLLLGLIVIAPLVQIHTIRRDFPPAQPDLIPVWVGTRVALHHGNPYSAETTRAIQTVYYGQPLRPSDTVNPMAFAYPAHAALLFSPFAPLSWPATRLAWLILLPVLTIASVPLWLWVAGIHLRPSRLALTILLALAAWPTVWGIHQLQPTLFVAFLAALGCFLLWRGKTIPAGIVFALATIKPQLVGPLIVWLCLWTVLRRQWTFLASFVATLATLLLAATWLVPAWFASWRSAMASYVVYRRLQPDLQFLFGHSIGLILELALITASGLSLWISRRCEPSSPRFAAACAIALATTVCVLPNETLMIYNHVLLLPACLIVVFQPPASPLASHARKLALIQLGLDYLVVPVASLCDFLVPRMQFLTIIPFLDFLLPLLLAVTLTLDILAPTLFPRPLASRWIPATDQR